MYDSKSKRKKRTIIRKFNSKTKISFDLVRIQPKRKRGFFVFPLSLRQQVASQLALNERANNDSDDNDMYRLNRLFSLFSPSCRLGTRARIRSVVFWREKDDKGQLCSRVLPLVCSCRYFKNYESGAPVVLGFVCVCACFRFKFFLHNFVEHFNFHNTQTQSMVI